MARPEPAVVTYMCDLGPAPALAARRPEDLPPEIRHLRRPPASPRHCKPWVDAMSLGWSLPFAHPGSLEVRRASDGGVVASWLDPGSRSRPVPASNFADGYFGLATGYAFRTPPGIGLLVTALPMNQSGPQQIVPGLVETDWYPKPLFVVLEAPALDGSLRFSWGDPIAWLIPVPTKELRIAEADGDARVRFIRERNAYDQFLRAHGELRWTSAEGHGFSRQYRVCSRTSRHLSGGDEE